MTNTDFIRGTTQVCAVIGNPIAHSLSPAIHNAAFRALDLDFVYVAFRVEQVADALRGMRGFDNLRGLSVTIPHKVEVMKHVDHLSDLDRHIGAINTVVKQDGQLHGLGTDGPGALKALRDAGVDVAGKRVLLLGAGGAARAIAFTLAGTASPAGITLMDLDAAVLDRLAADLTAGTSTNVRAIASTEATLRDAVPAADILIHCTPVGMHPREDASLVPPDLFRPGQVVFDIVYNPYKTRLLKDAEARGLQVVPGAEMFVNQAVLQFEAFTGRPAPVEVMRKVVLDGLTR